MRFVGPAALAMLFAAGAPARAELAVVSGGRVKLATMGAFDPVCHPLGHFSVGVIQQPHAGAILVDHINDFPNFPTTNTRSRCNTLKLPETRIIYQSSPGYVGRDEAIVETISPQGAVRRLRFIISVRPGVLVPQPSPRSNVAPRAPSHHHAAVKAHHRVQEVRRAPPARKPAHAAPVKPAPAADKPLSI